MGVRGDAAVAPGYHSDGQHDEFFAVSVQRAWVSAALLNCANP
ncbi:hypothetical protein I553_9461 [Mycobacterium xenopi 4042]|uniref:Uncharacterized protein n=1 Tax=Mycobacterium xenopi 4042 TaxID=1299334 RepID=X8E0H9_MYCXE|nr:hypothetical protein I553_9461 [Mycobacterium xenopi 4042]